MQNFSAETYKTLKQETNEDLYKWRDICIHGSKDAILLRCPFSNFDVQIECNLNQNPSGVCLWGFFVEIDEMILKLIWKRKGSRISKTILKTKTKLQDSHYLMSRLTIKPQ